jgi:hypothetical protein
MSNARAVAAVTATLKRRIFQAVSTDPELSGTQVTARPPDRARTEAGAGNQINLFLFRTSLAAAWRNQDPPRGHAGGPGQPALPLVLSYLVTFYGENDDEVLSHRLLGLGMKVLHDQPELAPAAIAAALPGSGLETQVERVRITPHPIPLEEISSLWATFQTGYRLSVSYDVAVVLIDSGAPARVPLPVLSRGLADAGPLVMPAIAPVITSAAAPGGRPGVRPGEQLMLRGRNLAGVREVRLASVRLAESRSLVPDSTAADEVRVTVPAADPLPAGVVNLVVVAPIAGGTELVSRAVPVGFAPTLVTDGPTRAARSSGGARILLRSHPPVGPDQIVMLVVGDQVVPAAPADADETAARPTVAFAIDGFAPGTYVLRLRVDGLDSVPLSADGHSFDDRQTLVLS